MIKLNTSTLFSFQELPEHVREDFIIQIQESELDEYSCDDIKFKIELVPLKKLLEEMDNIFGPNLVDELESDYVIELTKDIKTKGLLNLPIGSEGIHRSLAFINLQKSMPRFKILYPCRRNKYARWWRFSCKNTQVGIYSFKRR